MKIPSDMPRLTGFRFPRETIAYAVRAYHRIALSTGDVEDLLAERGVIVSREAIRLWVNRFGCHFADCIKRERPGCADKWHLDLSASSYRHARSDALDLWQAYALEIAARLAGAWQLASKAKLLGNPNWTTVADHALGGAMIWAQVNRLV